MGVILRDCTPELALALQGNITLYSADVYQIALVDGTTVLYWTTWNRDLEVAGQAYTAGFPVLKRSKWSVVNTMQVATMDLIMGINNNSFQGGASLKTQMYNGLFDGATVLLSRAYMRTPNDTSTFGTIDLFGGDVGALDITGISVSAKIKAKSNRLDMNTPRNIFKVPCIHGFCDDGCTLSRAAFTTSHTVGSSLAPSRFFVPWDSVPADPTVYRGGTVAFQSGGNSGSRRMIAEADSNGVYPVYPLPYAPVAGDNCTYFEGCDKLRSGSTQSCTARSNTQHYRGFKYVPPPLSAT